jgi:hypothetical protein
MTQQPKPAPKTPRPIRDDPKVGQYQVGISYRRPPWPDGPTAYRKYLELEMANGHRPITNLYVTVYEVGAGGERSEHEGTIGLTEDIEPVRATRNLDTGGRT